MAAKSQIIRLFEFLLAEFPLETKPAEDAADMAIRLLTDYKKLRQSQRPCGTIP